MFDPSTNPAQSIPPSSESWLRREAIYQRFERAWQDHGAPILAEFLPPPGAADRREVLEELVQIDLEYRWARRQPHKLESFIAQFPELGGADELPWPMVEAEIRARRLHGDPIEAAELAGRFPQHAQQLATWLAANPVCEDRTAPNALLPDQTLPSQTFPAHAAAPSRLDRYELREQAGQGGFSTVYRAWDPALHREVAIKLSRWDGAGDAELQARIAREARSAARLRHPAIVPIHDVGADGGRTYIVSQFVAGPTLADVLRQTRPAAEQCATWVAAIADALEYAHQNGIIHRDVKPANVLMDGGSRPMLADFGLARPSDVSASLTQDGAVLGTPAYMAPEQARGSLSEVGPRSDVYSLGALLYESLCGRLPFHGTSSSVLHQVVHDEPPPPRRICATVPADLETICLKALNKEPAGRYATAGALADDLRRFLRHEPIHARRVSIGGRLVRWCRREPVLAGTIAAAIVAIAVVAGVSFRQIVGERDRLRQERDRAQENLYDALVGEATAELRGRTTGWYWKALDKIEQAGALKVPARNVQDLRDLAVRCMSSTVPCFRLHATWTEHAAPVLSVAFAPDGEWIASASKDQAALRRVSGKRAVVTPAPAAFHQVVFDPKDRFMAVVADDGRLRLWDLEKLKQGDVTVLEEITLQGGGLRTLAVEGKGRWLAVGTTTGAIHLMERTAPTPDVPAAPLFQPRLQYAGHSHEVTRLDFAPDGKLVVSCSRAEKAIRAWDVRNGKQAASWSTNDGPSSVAFGASGLLAWSTIESMGFGRFSFRDREQLIDQTGAHSDLVHQVAWCMGMVLTASRDGSLKLWQQNTAVAEARGDFSDVRCVAVSPDSRWVVAGHGDGTVRLWEVAQPTQHVRFGLYNDLAFLKSGRQLIAQYHCFDVTDMHRPKQLDWGPAPVVSAIGGADGTLTVLRTNRLESWDTAAMRPLRSRPLDATVRCAAAHRAHAKGAHAKAASADGAKVKFAAGTDAGLILMIEEGEAPKNAAITTPLGSIHGVAWNDVGTQIAAVGEYGVALWDVASTAKPRWWIDSPWQPSGGVSIHGDQVATSSADGAIILRSSATGEPRRSLRGHAGRVTCLAFSADGQWLASAGTDDHVRVWDPAPNGALQDSALATFPVVHTPGWLCFDPSGRWLIGGGTQDSYAWDLRRHVLAALLRPGGDLCGQFSADGKTLLLGMHFGAVHACTVDELEQSARKAENTGAQRLDVKTTVLPARHMFAVWGVAASPDGKWLATAGHDERVHLWRSDSRELVASLTGRAGLVWTVAFSPDSRHVASGGPGIKIWDVEGRERFDLTGHQGLVVSLAYHPKRPWLFSSGNDGTVRLWDTSNGKELGILHRFTGAVNKLAVDPAGRWLAAACHDHHVALWDLSKQLTGDAPDIAAGQPPQRLLKGHANSVWAVGFSPDSRTLVSGSADGAVHLWETDGFTRLTTIHAPSPRVRTVAFTDDGRYLGIACFAGQGAIWDLDALRKSLQNMHLDW